jgi:hypothetical protein
MTALDVEPRAAFRCSKARSSAVRRCNRAIIRPSSVSNAAPLPSDLTRKYWLDMAAQWLPKTPTSRCGGRVIPCDARP